MVNDLHINDLPLETIVEILLKIDGKTLGGCRRVCKRWKEFIDEIDYLWQEMCRKEFTYSSKIAKRKAGTDCSWYHIYRNLNQWSDLTKIEKNIKEFYKFNIHDKSHVLDIDYGILPLKDSKGIILYDVSTFKYIPAALPERNCLKIVNNDNVTVVQIKSGILIQRSADTHPPNYVMEEFFKADDFVLTNDMLYFYNNRDIYKCDLSSQNLTPILILHCDYDIKNIQHCNDKIHVFTDSGHIVNITNSKEVTVKPIKCPVEWIKQLKYIRAVNDKNFVCYSRNIFKIETDKYQHLYLEFPLVTALFFYVDVVLIGTKAGEILLYRLASQKKATLPIFETLATLPDGKYAVQLDVIERKTGPTIIASTFFELFLLEMNFFPNEPPPKQSFSKNKMHMYKRLLKLKNRFQAPQV
ncbi:uncharacterized protein LOC124540838 [Vanessa cardui]|uniref:uncharacterized protein LOC124540838 n=1 Tax=Vanessa cardui TaxID=171605 RepID=UPI001F134DC4|nr:uncharacterized protein LOC124540838 [Vanessa cardui]